MLLALMLGDVISLDQMERDHCSHCTATHMRINLPFHGCYPRPSRVQDLQPQLGAKGGAQAGQLCSHFTVQKYTEQSNKTSGPKP